jgi:hypothetical protein
LYADPVASSPTYLSSGFSKQRFPPDFSYRSQYVTGTILELKLKVGTLNLHLKNQAKRILARWGEVPRPQRSATIPHPEPGLREV